MIPKHGDAIVLEAIVRSVFSCDRGEMGGFIDADHFESQPFDAALIALAPLWQNGDFNEIEDFLYYWGNAFRNEDIDNIDVHEYISQLDMLVTTLKGR